MRNLFLKDLGWKLLSLCLAIGIWLTVHNILTETISPGKPDTESTNVYSNQPVRIVSATSDVHAYRVAPEEVTVTLVGPAELMANLQASQIHAVVDVSGVNMTRDVFREVQVSPPARVTLIGVEPPQVMVMSQPARP
jgi:YbbR domain-containing protein